MTIKNYRIPHSDFLESLPENQAATAQSETIQVQEKSN